MVAAAAPDAPYYRFRVPGTAVVLYDVKAEDIGKPYADGVDNDADGAVDEGIDENIDEMIDERRDDGIDNDGDWRSSLDDVGLDGADLTNDRGERDGVPTSGAGTGLPGEPNIDVTDTSESDQIGITNVKYKPAGGINYQTIRDDALFFEFMVPGQFTLIRPARRSRPGPGRTTTSSSRPARSRCARARRSPSRSPSSWAAWTTARPRRTSRCATATCSRSARTRSRPTTRTTASRRRRSARPSAPSPATAP